MGAMQLELLSKIDEKRVQRIVVDELKNYRAMKVRILNKIEQEEAGMNNLFPMVRESDHVQKLKVQQIERAMLHSLDVFERRIIEMKYLNSYEINDIEIYLELGLKKGKYYEKKRTAVFRLATALGII